MDASDRPPVGGVVGVDIGGTKTHVALGVGGVIQREGFVRTSTWRAPSAVHNAKALRSLVLDLLGAAALDLPVAIGAHGCDNTQQCLDLQNEVGRYFTGPVLVVNDAEIMPPAMGVPGGIGMVAGTGSIAVARDAEGRLVTAGGWGWVLGDEGSAAGIVREAVRATLGELDRGRTGDPLTAPLLTAFSATDGAELALAVTRSNSADWWGSHAELVFHAADEGSPVAAAVLARAGAELAGLVDRLVARGVRADRIVAGGAVIQKQARLRDAVTTALRAAHPEITLSVLDREPIYGALALAGRTEAPTPDPSHSFGRALAADRPSS
jgi:N-acetylglucosamine kinase-like BadF-type ATPase